MNKIILISFIKIILNVFPPLLLFILYHSQFWILFRHFLSTKPGSTAKQTSSVQISNVYSNTNDVTSQPISLRRPCVWGEIDNDKDYSLIMPIWLSPTKNSSPVVVRIVYSSNALWLNTHTKSFDDDRFVRHSVWWATVYSSEVSLVML